MEYPLIAILLDPAVSWKDFQRWLDACRETRDPVGDETVEIFPAFEIPESVSARFTNADLKLMRPEIGLAVINFIRDQITSILEESPNSFPTPAKAAKVSVVTPAAKKYDYRSPVKSVSNGGRVADSKNRGGRIHGNKHSQRSSNAGAKRAQLLEADRDGDHSTFGTNINDALPKITHSHTINALEERCNGPRRTSAGAGGESDFQPCSRSFGRRSLGPEFERSNAAGKGRPPPSFGDFVTPPAKTGKQKKKGKKSPIAYTPTDSQQHDTYTIKTRKTKSLSPTVVNRTETVGYDVSIEAETTIAVPGSSQSTTKVAPAKITEEYKAQFVNANIWSQITREFQEERVQGELSSNDSKNQSCPSLPSSKLQTSNVDLVSADPTHVTKKAELDK